MFCSENYFKIIYNFVQTIGAEFCVKQVVIPETNVVVELFIYDCAGQSIFNQLDLNSKYVRFFMITLTKLTRMQYDDASAVMVVYSVINRESLQSCGRWYTGEFISLTRIHSLAFPLFQTGIKNFQPANQLIGALVGNKAEYRDGSVDSRVEVSLEEARQMSLSLNLPYFETSAVSSEFVCAVSI